MAKTLGIDIGTTTTSALLFDTGGGRVAAQASAPSPPLLSDASGLQREQHCGRVVRTLQRVLTNLAAQSSAVLKPDAVSVTGQMHGFVILDGERRPISHLITWLDKRALMESPSGRTWLQVFLELIDDTTSQPLGMVPAAGYAGPTIFALRQTKGLPAEAASVATLHDWIVSELLGRRGAALCTDPSFAQSTGLYLPAEGEWNRPLLERMGIGEEMLPRVREPGAYLGETAEGISALPPGLPVFTGMGDNQASLLGSLRAPEDSLLLNVGTGGQVSLLVEGFPVVEGLDTRVFSGGRIMLVGATLCAGRALALLKDLVAGIGRDVYDLQVDESAVYDRLAELGLRDTDLACRTTFAGTRAEPHLRGCLENIGEHNLTIADLAASVLRGIIGELHDLYGRMREERSFLVGSGTALRKNAALRRRAESAFAGKLLIPAVAQEACLGAALCAAVGIGAYPSFLGAGSAVRYLNE